MKDEKPPLSSAVLLADLVEKVEHIASASAMGAAQMTRAVRILDGNHALSARDRMALVDAYEKVQRVTLRLESAVDKLSPRPKSLTVVAEVERDKEDDTGVFIRLPGMKERKKVPTKILVPAALVIGGVVHWLGAQFPTIWNWIIS